MMTKIKMMIAVALASAVSLPLAAQICKTESIVASIEADQLIDNSDGTVTDAKTGLVWSQCSIGQEWSESGCSGEPANLEWQGALQAASQFNHSGGLAGEIDWRLPNIKELGSIVEHQCHSPAINEEYFPETPSESYLSSTVQVDKSGVVQGGRSIYFGLGSDLTPQVNAKRHARLVRSN